MADPESIEDGMEGTSIEIEEDTTEKQTEDGKKDSSRLAQLPHTRIRNMMKLDTDLHIASQDSVFLVTKAAVSSILSYITSYMGGDRCSTQKIPS